MYLLCGFFQAFASLIRSRTDEVSWGHRNYEHWGSAGAGHKPILKLQNAAAFKCGVRANEGHWVIYRVGGWCGAHSVVRVAEVGRVRERGGVDLLPCGQRSRRGDGGLAVLSPSSSSRLGFHRAAAEFIEQTMISQSPSSSRG